MAGRREGAYLLYDFLLVVGSVVLAPYVALRSLFSSRFRRSLAQRLGRAELPPEHPAGGILLHGVSVGEVKAIRPLLALLRERCPDLPLVVSSTTRSGRETAQRTYPEAPVVAFPLDLPFACRRFLEAVRPSAVVLMELEIWPNFLRACSRAGVPVAIVNGRITERSMSGYRRVQRLLPQFDRIRLYGVQNDRYAERFRQLDVPPDRVQVTGNLKYDNLPRPKERAGPWRAWIAGRRAVALASTHQPEEEEILRAAFSRPELDAVLFLVVPRHPDRAPRLLRQLRGEASGRPVLLRSELRPGEALPLGAVLLVDSFGELEAIYAEVDLAFVGGSLLPHGGQNVLEPAALGCPVLVGPHTENFAEEVALLRDAGALQSVESAGDLVEYMCDWLEDPAKTARVGQAASRALEGHRGAARTTLAALEQAGIFRPSATP